MATQLTLVNNVLRRLREDTVTSVADNAYAQLIAIWVNDGIREATESYDWSSLRHEITVDIVDGTSEYDLSKTVTGGGSVIDTGRVTTHESMLTVIDGQAQAFLYDSSADNEVNVNLKYMTEDQRLRRANNDRDNNTVDSDSFSLPLATTGDGYLLRLWPTPDATRFLRITFWTPQAELAIDGTDDATEIVVPNAIVEAYVHMTAANERGEEIGEPGNLLELRFQRVLAGALEAAMNADGWANRYESVRD